MVPPPTSGSEEPPGPGAKKVLPNGTIPAGKCPALGDDCQYPQCTRQARYKCRKCLQGIHSLCGIAVPDGDEEWIKECPANVGCNKGQASTSITNIHHRRDTDAACGLQRNGQMASQVATHQQDCISSQVATTVNCANSQKAELQHEASSTPCDSRALDAATHAAARHYNTYGTLKMEQPLQIARNDGKELFEEEKERVLSQIPAGVKDAYGQVGFAPRNGSRLPVLALNPYNLPPGPVRIEYLDMFAKVRWCVLVLFPKHPCIF